MNKVYRSVWNTTTNTWAAAAETAKSRSKGSARVARTAVAALLLGGASMTGAFAAEADTAEEDKKASDVVSLSQAPTIGMMGTKSIGTDAIGTMANVDDAYVKVRQSVSAGATGASSVLNAGGIAIGSGSTSSIANDVALGTGATATGSAASSAALGAFATANGNGAVAVGGASTATGAGTTALGLRSTANTINSTAVGNGAIAGTAGDATNTSQVALGTSANAQGLSAVAVGNSATTNGSGAVAMGRLANAGAANTTALGNAASASAVNSVALGANSVANVANTVSVGAVGSERQIVNVAAGTRNTDAVNLGQMNTALSTKADNDYIKVGPGQNPAALAATSGRAGNIAIGSNARSQANSLNSASVALGENTLANNAGSVAVGTDAQSTGSGSVAVGLRAQATAAGAIALGNDSLADQANTVSIGNATTKRKIVNMAAGTQATDAVNVSQLAPVVAGLGGGATINPDGSVTGPTYTLTNGGTQTTVGGALGALDGALTTANGNIARNTTDIINIRNDMNSGSIGLVQQASAGANLTVGKSTDGAAVDFTNNASQQRKLIGVADGAVSSISKEAINGSQLHGVADSVASAIGAGSTVNPDGSISAPSFTVGDGHGGTTTVHNVGAAVTNLNDRVTGNETSITDIRNEMSSGTIGLVQQAGAGANLTVGKSTDGAAVDFTNNASQQRKLIGVADGAVSTISKEAINGSQLRGVSDSVASAIGAGSTVNPDGSITAPSFTVGDGSGGTTIVHNVGAAVTNLNDRVTTNEGDITNIRNDLSSGSIGLVQQASAGAELTVGKNTDGAVVNFAGTAGDRKLSGVANGTADNDAASIAQLKAMGLFDPNDGRALAAVVYDGIDLKNVTLGGTGGTYLNNVRAGEVSATSMQAVNGSQLFALDRKLEGLDGRVGAIEAGGTGGGSGGGGKDPGDFSGSGTGSTQLGAGADASGSNSSAIGNGSSASGSNGTAIGQGSSASGDRGTAIGQGSSATHDNSVALGAGSTTDRDGSVSVGSEGNERQITNVRAGTAPTDAVNVQQMNNAVHSARQDAMGGVAAAMAVAGLPQSTLPGRTFMAIAGSTYGNEYGTAIGASYMTKDGKWIVKGAVNTSSRGEVGAVVGGGFYW